MRRLSFLILIFAGCSRAAPPATQSYEDVSFLSGKETVRAILYRPATSAPTPAVVLIHDDHGVTDWVKLQARRLAGAGYAVLAVDLYRGVVVNDLLDAHIMERGLPEDRVLGDLKAAVDYLAQRPDVRADRIGVIGFDIGGGYALDAATHDPRLRAVVTCYGRLTTDPELLAPLQAPVLGIFGGRDEGIGTETLRAFESAMHKAGLQVYPDCPHGFLNPSSSENDGKPHDEAVADAWRRIEAFLTAELR